jgi:16S rRNA (adenine1518-N6/adenine1519-N6)-dimethyltransferase
MSGYVKPKKHLGQHFLADRNIAAKIAASLDYGGLVTEIGPGKGILTGFLLERYGEKLQVVEIDDESVAYLKENKIIPEDQIIHGDFLKLAEDRFPSVFALIGNLPYNISSPVFFRLLEMRQRIPGAVFMIQKEVAERICAPHGNKTYGILSVLLQAFFRTEYLFTVGEKVFVPPPRVKSAVIRLTRRENIVLGCNEELFFRVVKTAFNQRRKTLSNSLKPLLGDKKPDADFAGLRAEQLSVNDFIRLTQTIEI